MRRHGRKLAAMQAPANDNFKSLREELNLSMVILARIAIIACQSNAER